MIQIAHVDRLELAAVTGGPSDGHRRLGAESWSGWVAGLAGAALAVILLFAGRTWRSREGSIPAPGQRSGCF